MKHNKLNKKAHQVGSVLIIVALITSFFAIGLYTENKTETKITGAVTGMESVTGMAEVEQTEYLPADYGAVPVDDPLTAEKPEGSIFAEHNDQYYRFPDEETYQQWNLGLPPAVGTAAPPPALVLPGLSVEVELVSGLTVTSNKIKKWEELNPNEQQVFGGKGAYEKFLGEGRESTKEEQESIEEKVQVVAIGENTYAVKYGKVIKRANSPTELEQILTEFDKQKGFFENIPEDIRKKFRLKQPTDFTIERDAATLSNGDTLKQVTGGWEVKETKTETKGEQQIETTNVNILDNKAETTKSTVIEIIKEEDPTKKSDKEDKEEVEYTYVISKTEVTIDQNKNERTEKTYEVEDGKETNNWKSVTTDATTGKPKRIETSDGRSSDNNDILRSELETLTEQYTWRQRFYQFERILTDFSGLGYIATLFMDDEDLSVWRESVDEVFATLYLGQEYWESGICASYVDRDQEGVAYVDTRLGLAGVAAHIEASRGQAAILPEGDGAGNEYLYKITFNVKNGDWDEDPKALEVLKFNIFLKGQRTVKLYQEDIRLRKGDQFGALGKQAVVQYSNYLYDKICMKFDDVPSFWTLSGKELCNEITTPSGATSIGGGEQATQQQTSGSGNVNDI